MSRIVIRTVLEYEQEDLEFMRGEEYATFEAFKEAVFDQFQHDIWESLRTDSVDDFCEVYEFNDKEAN
jgi:hypothetical protein